MPVAFLSPEWIADLDRVLRAAGTPPTTDRVVIQQRIDDAGTEIAYTIIVDAAGARATAGTDAEPTITFRQSRSVAVAIADGSTTSHEAFMLGQLTIEGTVEALIDRPELSAWIDQTIAPLRSETSF